MLINKYVSRYPYSRLIMKISIITTTYNSGLTLCDTIESVLIQKYADIEYIIIDGNSTDDTIDIIRKYKSLFNGRLHYISEPDKGIYDAMNKGIKIATGEIIGFLNSDDLFCDNNIIELVANAFFVNEIDAVFGNLYFVDKCNISKIVRVWKGTHYVQNSFRKGWHPAHPTFYVKKEIYDRLGGFDISFKVSADFELMLRFIEKNQISTYYLNYYFLKMRMGGESTKNIFKIIEGNKNVLRAFEKNRIPISCFYLIWRLLPKFFDIIKFKLKI